MSFFLWLFLILINLACAAWNIGMYNQNGWTISLWVAFFNLFAAIFVAANPPRTYY